MRNTFSILIVLDVHDKIDYIVICMFYVYIHSYTIIIMFYN